MGMDFFFPFPKFMFVGCFLLIQDFCTAAGRPGHPYILLGYVCHLVADLICLGYKSTKVTNNRSCHLGSHPLVSPTFRIHTPVKSSSSSSSCLPATQKPQSTATTTTTPSSSLRRTAGRKSKATSTSRRRPSRRSTLSRRTTRRTVRGKGMRAIIPSRLTVSSFFFS